MAQPWYTDQDNGRSASPPENDRPLGELFSDMTQSFQVLVRKEVELAKVEVKEQASRAGKAAGMLMAGGLVGFFALLLLSFAVALGLAEGIPTWLAFLAVGLLYAAVAGLLLVAGKKKLAAVKPVPRQTVETLREDVEVAKNSLSRGAST
ncbi:MAG: phage holin family protein [Acidimicrobiales bacterium]